MMQTYRQRAAAFSSGAMEALGAFVDEIAAMKMVTQEPATILRIAPSGIDVLRREAGREAHVFSAKGRPQEAVKRVIHALGEGLGQDCAIDIASGLAVTSRMILPSEAEGILKAIIRNKVEGIAPWPLAQSVFGERIAPIPGDAAHVAVDVAVVSRALLEDISSSLAEAGCEVRSSTLALADGARLRLGFGTRRGVLEARRHAVRIAGGIATLAAAVAALGMFLVWQAYAGLAGVRAETARLSAALTGGTGQATTLAEAANLLHERRRMRLPAAAVLEELSLVLPPQVWLESVSLEDVRLELRGQGSGIPALIEVLEQSHAFRDVNFSAATQFNAELNAEAFSIGATLETAGGATP